MGCPDKPFHVPDRCCMQPASNPCTRRTMRTSAQACTSPVAMVSVVYWNSTNATGLLAAARNIRALKLGSAYRCIALDAKLVVAYDDDVLRPTELGEKHGFHKLEA